VYTYKTHTHANASANVLIEQLVEIEKPVTVEDMQSKYSEHIHIKYRTHNDSVCVCPLSDSSKLKCLFLSKRCGAHREYMEVEHTHTHAHTHAHLDQKNNEPRRNESCNLYAHTHIHSTHTHTHTHTCTHTRTS